MLEIVPATAKLLHAYYGEREIPTTYALVVLDEASIPVAVAGLTRRVDGSMLIYSDSSRAIRAAHPITLMRVTRRLIKLADERGWRVSAYAEEDVDSSERFLEHFGFVRVQGREYVRWQR
jgi:hypothetical protein